ncbi:MAG: hypothetical protein ACI4QM_02980 [Alphaproteobacteria bacterium]
MKYRSSDGNKHYVLKGIAALVVLFLIFAFFAHPQPTVVHVEKTVQNALTK